MALYSGKSSGQAGSSGFGLTSHPTVWSFALVILIAGLLLALLRHLFGSIRVEIGSK